MSSHEIEGFVGLDRANGEFFVIDNKGEDPISEILKAYSPHRVQISLRIWKVD
jgi:hypothetical protein